MQTAPSLNSLRALQANWNSFDCTYKLSTAPTSSNCIKSTTGNKLQLFTANHNYLEQFTQLQANCTNFMPSAIRQLCVHSIEHKLVAFHASAPTATYLHVCQTKCTYCKPLAMFQPARPTWSNCTYSVWTITRFIKYIIGWGCHNDEKFWFMSWWIIHAEFFEGGLCTFKYECGGKNKILGAVHWVLIAGQKRRNKKRSIL